MYVSTFDVGKSSRGNGRVNGVQFLAVTPSVLRFTWGYEFMKKSEKVARKKRQLTFYDFVFYFLCDFLRTFLIFSKIPTYDAKKTVFE